MTEPKAILVGDSWIHGLNFQQGNGFGRRLLAPTGAEILDLSAISKMVVDAVRDDLPTIRDFRPDFAVVNLGGAESLARPAPVIASLLERMAPPSWRGLEGLQPRALFSRSSRRRRARQQFEQLVKALTKHALLLVGGPHQWMPPAEVEEQARALLDVFAELGTEVLVVGTPHVDPWLSPRTNKTLRDVDDRLRRLAAARGMTFVGVSAVLDQHRDYLSDGVHLVDEAHARLAAFLADAVADASPRWRALLAASPDGAEPPGAVHLPAGRARSGDGPARA